MHAAAQEIWDAGDETPVEIDREHLLEFLAGAYSTNVAQADHPPGYSATLSWGISIGVLAERNRREREDV